METGTRRAVHPLSSPKASADEYTRQSVSRGYPAKTAARCAASRATIPDKIRTDTARAPRRRAPPDTHPQSQYNARTHGGSSRAETRGAWDLLPGEACRGCGGSAHGFRGSNCRSTEGWSAQGARARIEGRRAAPHRYPALERPLARPSTFLPQMARQQWNEDFPRLSSHKHLRYWAQHAHHAHRHARHAQCHANFLMPDLRRHVLISAKRELKGLCLHKFKFKLQASAGRTTNLKTPITDI